jgi:hypothetical protein
MGFTATTAAALLGVNAALSSAAVIKGALKVTAAEVWQPAVGDAWQIVLRDSLKLSEPDPIVPDNVPIFDIDLYDNTKNGKDNSTIVLLHKKGKKVICYFSAGTYESNRTDSADFKPDDIGNKMEDKNFDESWVNIASPSIREIMTKRIALAGKMGCDAIDPDNIDGYVSRTTSVHP